MIPRKTFFKIDKLNNVKKHLKENGLFCFHLILSNKFSMDEVINSLKKAFYIVKNERINKLDYWVYCFND